jgi:hypothetical protein
LKACLYGLELTLKVNTQNFRVNGAIDLKRITRYKLALIFESADHRKFLGLYGSEAARLSTSNEATLEGYALKHVFNQCDSIMKNVINKQTKTKKQ